MAWSRLQLPTPALRSVLPLLPTPVSYLLGYRARPSGREPLGSPLACLIAAATTFLTLLLLSHLLPPIPGSFGATTVLTFLAPFSPLAQPRNAILSQTLSSFIGVALATLIPGREKVVGPMATACAGAVMSITGTVHPPAGATALLAVTGDEGWAFVGVATAGGALAVAVQCLVGNVVVGSRWPLHWWSPDPTKDRDEAEGEKSESVVIGREGAQLPEWLEKDVECCEAIELVRKRLVEGMWMV